ncbi:isoquinoline 1-oxidoreductase [Sinorhizobium medicae]|uniref:(2Fe-2S)-binding protein n=1 Tax=Sinorhizobium medicae TaxID=110321 RepID=UPI000C7C552A|nr:(2Fe-2S)-binding protein [Sinorhizobium medicae]PLU40760.1 isoquinoline 1-oxidoreductase [Sinorhizobium medicae]
MVNIKINGVEHAIEAEADMPLLWAIRDLVGLTGTKFGCGMAQCGACTVYVDGSPTRSCQTCGMAQCGACTVYVDGSPTRSCQTFIGDIDGAEVTTIEGLKGKVAETVQSVWAELDVPQCGYCQSGQIMSATDLLASNPKPTDTDIDAAMSGNLCRCATYHRIRAGIHEAAKRLEA